MKKHLLAVGIICLFVFSSVPVTFGYNLKTSIENEQETVKIDKQPIDHIWPMHKYDPQRSGCSPYDTSQNNGDIKWEYFNDVDFQGSVAIDKDGVIYVGDTWDGFHAVYPNGTRKWKIELSGGDYQTPAIAKDGTIYVGTSDRFYAINPNGTIKWKFKNGNYFCEPIVDSNDTVYIATQDGYIYAINKNGSLKWEYYIEDFIFYITLDAKENIYFNGVYKNKLYCFNQNGSLKWTYEEVNIKDGPVIDKEGIIYIRSDEITALYPNGTEKWIFDMNDKQCHGEVSIAPDGIIILSGSSEFVTALNPSDGSIIWQYQLGLHNILDDISIPIICADGTIYVAYTMFENRIGYLCALTSVGKLKWKTRINSDVQPFDGMQIFSDPSIGSDGTVYITTWFFGHNSSLHDWGYIHTIGNLNPNAPEKPTINGVNRGNAGVNYEFTFKSTSPLGRDVYYFIDWGDASVERWIGPYGSGEEVVVSHTWDMSWIYKIKIRAKDTDNLWGHWSEHQIIIPRDKVVTNTMLLRILERFPLLHFLFFKENT